MSFEKNFCSSPWFHMRITNSGTYEYCRWRTKPLTGRYSATNNIQALSPLTYFQDTMSSIRQDLLDGKQPTGCQDCSVMEQYNKVSGRQRQLLKVGVLTNHFSKSLASSPFRPLFDYSSANNGHTAHTVTDWQIDLGNYCNSACIFCDPTFSSRIATEFTQLGLADQIPPQAWCDDPELLEKFCQDLIASPELRYLHFLGGETVITPGFKTILRCLVDNNLADKVTIGLTTNLTVFPKDIVELLVQFESVHLGMSIETMTSVNDYVRYPGKQAQIKKNLDSWVALGKQHNWFMQMRITPTCLTVHQLTTVFDYAWANNLSVESCNFIDNPKALRISVLPPEYRKLVVDNITQWITDHRAEYNEQIVNTRNSNTSHEQIVQDARSYLEYLTSAADESDKLPDLVKYLKLLESSRKNTILDYLPEYEELFRANGY